MRILHITSHLGGGVGRAISGLVEQSKMAHPETEHQIICLENLEKSESLDKIRKTGTKVIIHPLKSELTCLMRHSDIVQLEFWNHPALFKWLCTTEIPEIRLITWSHINGLFNPIIPNKLIEKSHKLILTSQCSLWNENLTGLDYVYSSGGFEFSEIDRSSDNNLLVGYLGSTNFSKIHPNYANFINEVNIPNFKVKVIGDIHNKNILEKQSDKLNFKGFVSNIKDELSSINVLAYILNPEHYGTTENALLECMSLGIVPIVLNNKCEECIVNDGIAGFIVKNKEEFAKKIEYLYKNPEKRKEMGILASKFVREKFSVERTELRLNEFYKELMLSNKREINFKEIFGSTPDKWFLSCQRDRYIFQEDGTIFISSYITKEYAKYMLHEETKGSVFHFSKYFPENELLRKWAENLKSLRDNNENK